MVTLTMVPDRFECRATAHFTAFKQRKKVLAREKPVMAKCGTLTGLSISFHFILYAVGAKSYRETGLPTV